MISDEYHTMKVRALEAIEQSLNSSLLPLVTQAQREYLASVMCIFALDEQIAALSQSRSGPTERLDDEIPY